MPLGLRCESIPMTARIVHAALYLETCCRYKGRNAAKHMAQQRSGKAFDPSVATAFLDLANNEEFWAGLVRGSMWDTVLALDPQSPSPQFEDEQVEAVALALADFVDLKSFYTAGHSRRVAELAERAAIRMRLPQREVTTIRRAALIHDVGLISNPSFVMNRLPEDLSQEESDGLKMHPEIAVEILSRMPLWDPIREIVSSHHEKIDGKGYPKKASGPDIPLGARIIAVADVFDDLTHDAPGRQAASKEQAIDVLKTNGGDGYDREVVRAFIEEFVPASLTGPERSTRKQWPAGLTEREVEILHLIAKGLSRRQMAKALYLSENTVRHHLEHIYSKIGVSTRVAAALFAMENGFFD
jgi:putative nucleotidyltransferase with HDIG domain